MSSKTLVVDLVSTRNCLVNIPEEWIHKLATQGISCFELSWPSGSCVVSWGGGASSPRTQTSHSILSSNDHGTLEIDPVFAKGVGLVKGQTVDVRECSDEAMPCSAVHVEPANASDWEIIELNANEVEEQLLNQARVVWEGMQLPFWVHDSCVMLNVTKVESFGPLGACMLLSQDSEVIVASKKRSVPTQLEDSQEKLPSGVTISCTLRILPATEENCGHQRERLQQPALAFTSFWSSDLSRVPVGCTPAVWLSTQEAAADLMGKESLKTKAGKSQNDQPLKQKPQKESDEDDELEVSHRNITRMPCRLVHDASIPLGHVVVSQGLLSLMASHPLEHFHVASIVEPAQQIGLMKLSPISSNTTRATTPSQNIDYNIRPRIDATTLLQRYSRLMPLRVVDGGIIYLDEDALASLHKETSHDITNTNTSNTSNNSSIANTIVNDIMGNNNHNITSDNNQPRINTTTNNNDNDDNDNNHRISVGMYRVEFVTSTDESESLREKPSDEDEATCDVASRYCALFHECGVTLELSSIASEIDYTPHNTNTTEVLSTHLPWAPVDRHVLGGLDDKFDQIWKYIAAVLPESRIPQPLTTCGRSGGILVVGQAGVGKTLLCKLVCQHAQRVLMTHVQVVDCSQLLGRRTDVVRQKVQQVIQNAKLFQPSILLWDGLDTLFSQPSEQTQDTSREDTLAEVFASACHELGAENNRVLCIATARTRGGLHASVSETGLFDLTVKLEPPDGEARAKIFKAVAHTAGYTISATSMIMKTAASTKTEGFVGKDFFTLLTRAQHLTLISGDGGGGGDGGDGDGGVGGGFNHSNTTPSTITPTATATAMLPKSTPPSSSSSSSSASLSSSSLASETLNAASQSSQNQQPLSGVLVSATDDLLATTSTSSDPTITPSVFEQALAGFTPASLHGIKLQSVDTTLDDVGGMQSTKDILLETLLWPSQYPELFAQCPLRMRSGILLYGPPGTGKTMIAGAIAAHCNLRFISIAGPELLSKYIGASEQSVRDAFARAQAASPSLLFFDEFDSVAPRRGHDSTGVTDRVVNQLLTELDGVEGLEGVFVVAATSRPELIDPALIRPGRLDKLVYCGVPDCEGRVSMLHALCRSVLMAIDVDLESIAQNTTGFSGADLKALVGNAQLAAAHEALESITGNTDTDTKTEDDVDVGVDVGVLDDKPTTSGTVVSVNMSNDVDSMVGELSCEDRDLINALHASTTTSTRASTSTSTSVPNSKEVESVKHRVTQSHLESALEQIRPSITPQELERYGRLEAEFSGKKAPSQSLQPGSRATLA